MIAHDSHADSVLVRRLLLADAEAYASLRREMLAAAPRAFSSSPMNDREAELAFARARLSAKNDAAIFGAVAADRLVGAVGIYRDPNPKAAHRMEVWGMYVDGGYRRRGLGRRLLDAAIAHARAASGIIQIQLGVTDAAPEALSLYESLGFRVWGIEPRALRHDGILIDERHMVLLFTT